MLKEQVIDSGKKTMAQFFAVMESRLAMFSDDAFNIVSNRECLEYATLMNQAPELHAQKKYTLLEDYLGDLAQRTYASAIIATVLMGSAVGFLIFNLHPAKIFMGDTGSLFLGALVVSGSLFFDNPLLILPAGGVYIIEGLSVILQVLYYKATKKRLFKMAPLHHHLERSGLSENTICIIAIIATLILSIPTFIFS